RKRRRRDAPARRPWPFVGSLHRPRAPGRLPGLPGGAGSLRLLPKGLNPSMCPPDEDRGLEALVAPDIDSTPDVVDSVALARLYGEPLFALPQDLYIPPDALEVFLEAFEGPLDLLLYLI